MAKGRITARSLGGWGRGKTERTSTSDIPFGYWCHVPSGSPFDNATYLNDGAAVPTRQRRATNDDLITTSECISADT